MSKVSKLKELEEKLGSTFAINLKNLLKKAAATANKENKIKIKMDQEISLENLTREELEDECRYLQIKCKQLRQTSEEDAQRIHELKRNLETANAAQQYLSQELEQLTAATTNGTADLTNNKLQIEHDELRHKYAELVTEYSTLQENYDTLADEHSKLRNKLEQLKVENEKNGKSDAQADFENLLERLQVLEHDNMELLQKLEEQRAEAVKQSMILAEKEKRLELMHDELMCLEENLRYKREEVEEKTQLLESAQEQLCEANGKINMLMSAPENKERKGNSLFAEVDDQRQVMKKMLASQKKSYQEMKKIYNESQYEIRRLKRENSAMHTELQACSVIFRDADRTYQEKLSGRIRYLLNENEALEKKLLRTQGNLKDLASERGVTWLDSMLNFCKQETAELKKQLYSIRIQNASLEEQLRNVQQELARWRFEFLKSRCLLIDRENILTEHKIAFKPQNSLEYNITAEELQQARPRIIPVESVQHYDDSKDSQQVKTSTTISDCNILSTPKQELLENTLSNSIISINDSIDCAVKENTQPPVSTLTSNKNFSPSDKNKANLINHQIISPQLQIKSVDTLNMELQHIKITNSSPLPSILCKERVIINEAATEKKVQFAANEATIHNLPASPNNSMLDVKFVHPMESENKDADTKPNSTSTTVKTMRTKSNVLVRRIVVNSKPK